MVSSSSKWLIALAMFLAALCFSDWLRKCRGQERIEAAKIGGRESPDGAPIQIDLPGELHLRNKVGTNGAGLCVFTSISHTARWQSIPVLENFRDYMTKYPGGGWPEKVDTYIAKICKEKSATVPRYLQVQKLDWPLLKQALASGRMPCVTYGFSPTKRYPGRISHMVNLSHADDKWACFLDNNFPGEDRYEWVDIQTAGRVIADRGAWFIIFLAQGPPPPVF